jgi:hypothetical protein
MTKKEKEDIIYIISKLYDDVYNQYKNAGYDFKFIKDNKVDKMVKIHKTYNKDKIKEIYNNAIKDIAQLQTDLAIHKLRQQNII